MSEDNKEERTIQHPLEEVFNIAPNSTVLPNKVANKTLSTTSAACELYDNKDEEIEDQFQTVYIAAMDAFDAQEEQIEIVDPRYRARNEEIAVQYLNTALNAAKEKANLKQHKDKLILQNKAAGTPGTVHVDNLIVGDRNDILRQLEEREREREAKPIEGKSKSINDE